MQEECGYEAKCESSLVILVIIDWLVMMMVMIVLLFRGLKRVLDIL